jgi:GT2 family glycosyltransferase
MPDSHLPRVSILIPNFDNGRQSSASGDRNFIGDLLESLHETLADEPTPFELIVYDDGSTDDSLQTLRTWANRTWPDGRPFMDLIEAEHCGVLAKTANVLSRRARGEILARLDGDIVCLTKHWVSRLCEIFDRGGDRLGVVGPKQLLPDGRIHAFGDFILHPNGYTHVACGMDRQAVGHPMQVDHVMGAFYCCRKAVFDDVGGYDENYLRGQTIDFGLLALLKGWACMAVPLIEFIHVHGLRKSRSTEADTLAGIDRSLQVFTDKWGFNRIAPDLEQVSRHYAGTPLLWNRNWFDDAGALIHRPSPPFDLGASRWSRYASDQACQSRLNFRVAAVQEVIRQTFAPQLAVQIGAGDGLLLHLLAGRGVTCLGVEAQADCVDFASQIFGRQSYPAQAPRIERQPDPGRVPLADGQADLVLLIDELERCANPVGILNESRRILAPGKLLLIISQRKDRQGPDPTDPAEIHMEPTARRLLWHELLNLVRSCGGWSLMMPPQDDPSRDMVLLLQRSD